MCAIFRRHFCEWRARDKESGRKSHCLCHKICSKMTFFLCFRLWSMIYELSGYDFFWLQNTQTFTHNTHLQNRSRTWIWILHKDPFESSLNIIRIWVKSSFCHWTFQHLFIATLQNRMMIMISVQILHVAGNFFDGDWQIHYHANGIDWKWFLTSNL